MVCDEDGKALKRRKILWLVRRVARRGQVKNAGVHVLRHNFCSHLAMRGAPARAIQELAGHADLSTKQRYMHLNPSGLKDAIGWAPGTRGSGSHGGEIGGDGKSEIGNLLISKALNGGGGGSRTLATQSP